MSGVVRVTLETAQIISEVWEDWFDPRRPTSGTHVVPIRLRDDENRAFGQLRDAILEALGQ